MMPQPPRERRAIALLLVLLGLAALLVAREGLRTGTLAPGQLPLPALMAVCAIIAGYATLSHQPRGRAK